MAAAVSQPLARRRPSVTAVRGALMPPLVAIVAGWSLLAYRSPYRGRDLVAPASWGRWDSWQYTYLAQHGYFAQWHCTPPHIPKQLPPGNYLCGTIGWFPGYPWAMRVVSVVTGVGYPLAGLILSWVCWYLVLVLVWWFVRDARSVAVRWLCLLTAACVPGVVYFAAIFPISLCAAGILGAVYFASAGWRPAPVIAGVLSAAVAGYSYLTGLVIAPALLVGALFVASSRSRRSAVVPAVGALVGFAAVLLTMQLTTGIWNAYFISAAKYGVGAHSPLETLVNRLQPLWMSAPPDLAYRHAEAEQTLLTMGIVLLAIGAVLGPGVRTLRHARTIDEPGRAGGWRWSWVGLDHSTAALDLTLIAATVGVWLLPYVAGGGASTYRSEAFVVVAVPLLRRLPAWLVAVVLALAVTVAWHIVPYFFNGQLM